PGASRDVIPWCRDHGTGVIVYSPRASGLLTGVRSRWWLGTASGEDRKHWPVPAIETFVEGLRPIARRNGVGPGAIATAWTLAAVTTLAFLAARTRSVRLGTGIVVLPLRNPLILAKGLSTVDVLSEGRLIFGIGVGYVEREFEALGIPFGDRGVRLEDHLAAI